MRIKLSVDTHCVKETPKENIPYGAISKTIASHACELTLEEIADKLEKGFTISSPIYKNGKRRQDNILEMQLFILDFDGDPSCLLSYSGALERAARYDLPVVISYETKSSKNFGRYRLIFLYNEPVRDIRLMNIINQLLLHVFPEADRSAKDLSKIFLPGRNTRYHFGKPFYLDSLIMAACSETSESGYKNLMRSFEEKYGLLLKGNYIYISYDNDNLLSDFCENSGLSIYLYMEGTEKSQKNGGKTGTIYFTEHAKEHRLTNSRDNELKYSPKNMGSMCDDCILLRDFESGRRLPHSEWFGLALNMLRIEGGRKWFVNIMDKYSGIYGDTDNKLMQLKYASKAGYNPQSCDCFCPYSSECRHETNIVLTLKSKHQHIKRIRESPSYRTIDDIRTEQEKFFDDAITNRYRYNVLKAPTGSGKSTAHLKFLRNCKTRTINAYPNTDLMMEKYHEAIKMGINAVHTPAIEQLYPLLTDEQREIIMRLYNNGAVELPIKLLGEWSSDNIYIKNYLKNMNSIPEDAHIFTTHARLLCLPERLLNNSAVIIDEDIIPMMISCSSVSLEEFHRLCSAAPGSFIQNKLYKIKENLTGKPHYFHLDKASYSADYKSAVMSGFADQGIAFTENIWGLLESENYYYCTADKSVHFSCVRHLKTAAKVIMMSATANEKICGLVFGNNINFCDTGQIKYRGKVILHHEKSYSRAFLASENRGEKIIKNIADKHGECGYITYKEYCRYIDHPCTYYGKALGTNEFEGRDIVIIGLNHRPFYVYELFAAALGINVSDTLTTRKVQLNGFEFYTMTYGNEELRNIQQYMIMSDLEQAVGRARLIHHDCTVHLYGNFPAEQSILAEEYAE